MSRNQATKAKKRSATDTYWKLLAPPPKRFAEQFPEYPAVVRQLLYNRGLTDAKAIGRFLSPSYVEALHDPFLLTDLDRGVKAVLEAIRNGERIVIHGDYDADGLTATSVLEDVLRHLGADVRAFVPSRYVEGYGVATSTLRRLHQEGAGLVITVDCGISSAAAIAAARADGLKVVVTDHHQPPAKLPVAEAVIDPHRPGDPYPNKHLAGVGVAFKLAQGLLAKSPLEPRRREAIEKWVLDLVALGTVADLMPLTGENRALVKYGLLVLQRARRPGLRALMRVAGIDPVTCDASRIGFGLAPRLNAAGRLTHATYALELLLTRDAGRAEAAARHLNELNAKRQAVTAEAVAEAKERLGPLTDEDRIIVLDGKWLSGIVGLVAGRLTQEFNRPALVIERGTDVARGSARSIPAFNIVEALAAHKTFLTTYGGHAGAAGFSLDSARLDEFREALRGFAGSKLTAEDLRRELTVEAELAPAELSFDTIELLEQFEPFGIDNPKPEFLLRDASVESVQTVGQDGSHLKLLLTLPDGRPLTALAFGMADHVSAVGQGRQLDLVGHPVTNVFRTTKSVEWHVTDFRNRD